MLKKAITYDTVDGESITEEFYFNLTKAELVEMEVSYEEGFEEAMKKIVADQNGSQIIAEMKKLILKSYGKRSPDGKRFIKNQELRDEFESSEAYSVLFMELVTEADMAVVFVQGIMPTGFIDENQISLSVQTPSEPPNLQPVPRKLTEAEFMEMDSDELKSGLATGKYII